MPNDVLANSITTHINNHFPAPWTEEEQQFARSIQKEMGKAEDGLAIDVPPMVTGLEIGGSTDVGDVSWNVPTMGVIYAAWPKHTSAHQWSCTACNGMSIGRKASLQAVRVLAAQGLELMTNKALLAAAKAELINKRGNSEYVSLNDNKENPLGRLDDKQRAHYESCLSAAMKKFGGISSSTYGCESAK
jgi:aminobenzoyl-glutamate utilization protein B